MKAIIDGDALVFSAGFATEKSEKGRLVSVEPVSHAFYICQKTIDKILTETDSDAYEIYLGSTDKSNFRHKIAKTAIYKDNRKQYKRPEHEVAIRDWLFKNHRAVEVQGMEVDDYLGIVQYGKLCETFCHEWDEESDRMDEWHVDAIKLSCHTIICSNDKDLDMIPGWHYDMDFGKTRTTKTGSYKLKTYKRDKIYFITDPGFVDLRVNPSNGRKVLCGGGYLWFCAQLLLGDKTDNIPSLAKGYGPVKAYELLGDLGGDLYPPEDHKKLAVQRVYEEYKKVLGKDLTTEQIQARLMEIAQLVWIKRFLKEDPIFPRRWLDDGTER